MKIVPNTGDGRTPVVLVAGLDADAVTRTTTAFLIPGTTVVHHDLSELDLGRVRRTTRTLDADGREQAHQTVLLLEHGCVSCTLRNDLLPLLRQLHRRDSVQRVVLQLDCALEPEALCFAITHAVVADMPGFGDAPASQDVRIEATVACVPEAQWLEAATSDVTMAEYELSATTGDDDERTVAQVAVGQVAFADALVIVGCDPALRDAWESARLTAVLKRLAPSAPIIMEIPQRPMTAILTAHLLAAIPARSRRGRIDEPQDPLLRDQPPLDADCGVELFTVELDRPFHPARLHEAIDELLDGVVSARGRLWLATQPDAALWLESAGGGLRIAPGPTWLVAMSEDQLATVDAERRALAALRWDNNHGDRHSALSILAHRPEQPEAIRTALRGACLTDDEMALGQQFWLGFDDPFGLAHTDPCADPPRATASKLTHRQDNR